MQIICKYELSAVVSFYCCWGLGFTQFSRIVGLAVVLAISTWPVYQRLLASNELHGKMTWVALGLTLLIGAIILAPLGYGLSRLLQEAQSLGQLLTNTKNAVFTTGLAGNLPIIGNWAKENWMNVLGSSEAANESLHWLAW